MRRDRPAASVAAVAPAAVNQQGMNQQCVSGLHFNVHARIAIRAFHRVETAVHEFPAGFPMLA
jgi:hypothetical protein